LRLYRKLSDTAVRRVYGKTASAVTGYAAAQLHLQERPNIAIRADQVFLDSFWGRSLSGNTYAVYLAMKQDPEFEGYRYVWSCRPTTQVPDIISNDPNVTFVDFGSPDYFNELAASSLIVHNANVSRYYAKRPGQTVVHLFHGVPLKRMGLDVTQKLLGAANTQRNFLMADVVMSASPAMTERLIDAYNAEANGHNVLYSGFPRLDMTLNGSSWSMPTNEIAEASDDGEPLQDHEDDDEGDQTPRIKVLYAPTWRGMVGSVDVSGLGGQLAALERFAIELQDTHDFVVSVHNYARNEAGELPSNCVYVDPKVPINVTLADIDVLITDYSSIVVDAIAANIPSVLYAYDEDEYNATRGLYEPLSIVPAAVCRTEEQVMKALVAARPPSQFDQYEAFRDKFTPHEDGRATERVLQAIKDHRNGESFGSSDQSDERHSILIAAADLTDAQTANELRSLLEHLDMSRFSVTLLVRTRLVDRAASVRARYLELRQLGCEVILISGRAVAPPDHREAFKLFHEGGYQSPEELENAWGELSYIFAFEVDRHLAGRIFDSVVDFDGTSVWWAAYCVSVPAANRVIWRRGHTHGNVGRTVRYLTRDFDAVCTPSIELASAARADDEIPCDFTWVPPAAPKQLTQRRASLKGRGRSLRMLTATRNSEQTYRHFVAVAGSPKPGQVATLLEAFADYLETDPLATMTLLASTKAKRDFSTTRRMLHLGGHVHRDRVVPNPTALLAQADLVIGFGDHTGVAAIVEASGLGTPALGIGLDEFAELGIQSISCRREIIGDVLRNPGAVVGPEYDSYHKSMLDWFEQALLQTSTEV